MRITTILMRPGGIAPHAMWPSSRCSANALLRTVAMDPRQRDSVILVMREALSPWNRRRLREESHGE